MPLTRTNLEDRCIQYGYGELDRVRFQDFLNQRYRDVLNRHRWSWNQSTSTLTLTAATNSATLLQTSYIFFGRLRPTTLNILEPAFIEWNNARYNEWTRRAFDPTNRAQPTLYSIRNDTVFFNFYADQTYVYEAQFYALPAYLTVGTAEPLLPDEDRETLVAGALMDQCLRDKDYQGADYWNKIYEGRIQEMWAKDRLNNQESERVVQMPDHYGGLWD